MRRWYEELFSNYAKTYDTECFTTGTLGEVDFLEKELNYDKSKSILDIGCGTGEQSVFLAEKGYDPSFGARPLRRAVMKYIEDPLAEEILKGTYIHGSVVRAKFDKTKEELFFVDAAKDTEDDQLKEHDEEIVDTK